MTALDVGTLSCIEIDTPGDLDAARGMRATAGAHSTP